MKSPFQTILVIVFAVVFAGAILVFSGLISFGSKKADTAPQGTVVVWGIAPNTLMQTYFGIINNNGSSGYTISYQEHDPSVIQQDLIVALGNGNPPDMVLYSSELLAQFKDKLYPVPYAAYPERTFRDTTIDGAQIFLGTDGIVGMPLVVDPLVVYYNKDILAKENFVVSPQTWSNLQQTVPLLTKRDERGVIQQSTIALGSAQNVDHMRDILSALFLQTGNSIVVGGGASTGKGTVVLASTPAGSLSAPTAQALDFYTSFANPTNTNYSWNSSLPSSLSQFIAGKSAFYIGRASELFTIQSQNPNLNFDVSQLFQTGSNTRPATFGSFLAIGIMKNAPNFTAAYAAAGLMSGANGIDALSKTLSLPPARRDLLLVQQANPYVSVFFNAALTAFAWPDPNPLGTENVFKTMVTAVTSGKSDAQTAVFDASRDLQSLLK